MNTENIIDDITSISCCIKEIEDAIKEKDKLPIEDIFYFINREVTEIKEIVKKIKGEN